MGSIVSGLGSMNEANYQSKVDTLNAGFAKQAASSALAEGSFQAGQAQTQGSQVIGEQKAGFGASGVDTGTGTPVELMADTRMMANYSAAIAKNNAARKAWGYDVQSFQDTLQAGLDTMKGKNAAVAGALGEAGDAVNFGMKTGAFTSLLGGA